MESPFLYRNLRRLPDLQERDRQVLQADPESSGNQRGPHHHRRLHVALLLQPGAAQAGADGGHLHRQEGGGAGPGARAEPHLGGRGSHLHGLTGLCREEDPERWELRVTYLCWFKDHQGDNSAGRWLAVWPDCWTRTRCFHRNRGHRGRRGRHHQTVVSSHLPTGCRTLPSGLQVRHARRQAAAAVRTWSTVGRVSCHSHGTAFLSKSSFLCWSSKISLVPLWAFKAPTGIKRTHSSAQTALLTEPTAFVCIYWNVYIRPSGKV